MCFHPERMASRILGMGDIVSLVEKAEQTMDVESATRLQKKIKKRGFDFEDFLEQLQQMKKLGSMSKIMEMLPGGGMMDQLKQGMNDDTARQADDYTRKAEAMIFSMTPKERRNPKIINGSRRKRIAAGSGVSSGGCKRSSQAIQAVPENDEKDGKNSKKACQGSDYLKACRVFYLEEFMAVKIRLRRTGGRNDVCYRVVAADTRSPRDGPLYRDAWLV